MPRFEFDVKMRAEGPLQPTEFEEDFDAAKFGLRIRAVSAEVAARINRLLRSVGQTIEDDLKGEGDFFAALPYDEDNDDGGHIHLRDTVRTSQMYFPGGAGGGGFYEFGVHVGHEGATPQLGFILHGTHGPITAGEGNLGQFVGDRMSRSEFSHAQAMPVRTGGRLFFRTAVSGQKPQTLWLESAHAKSRRLISRGVKDLDRRR